MAITLLLVRHGETAHNAEGRYQGQRDIPLSDHGRAQARRLAARFQANWRQAGSGVPDTTFVALPGPPVAVYVSDLSRASETAAILAANVKPSGTSEPSLYTLSALRERNFGVWEGLTAAEVQTQFGANEQTHGGETWVEVWARMDEALELIWDTHALPRASRTTHQDDAKPPVVLIVGHGGSLRAFVCRALGIEHGQVRRFRLDNTSLSIVELWGPSLAQSEGRVALLNDTSHLEGDKP